MGEARRLVLRSWQLRVTVALGLLLGFGATGAWAYLGDQATVPARTFTAGTLDIKLGEATGSGAAQSDDLDYQVLELDDVLPGESVSKVLVLVNAGSTPLRVQGTLRATNSSFAGNLLVSTYPGGARGPDTGTRESGDRRGACTAGAAGTWWSRKPVVTTAQPIITGDSGSVLLPPGAQLAACVLVELAATAPSSVQGASVSLEADFLAEQVR